jgi:hypothetical protein
VIDEEHHHECHVLAVGIAEHLAEWDRAHVELAIYGCDDPRAIACEIDDFCRRHLGSPATELIFYQSSIGAVAGLVLADGRKVVLKAHQPSALRAQLEEIVLLRQHVSKSTGLAPRLLVGPAPLGRGLATVEEYDLRGEWRDAHEPAIRASIGEFIVEERSLCSAAFAYSIAYTSRCGHSAGIDTRREPGTFQHLVATEGARLLCL